VRTTFFSPTVAWESLPEIGAGLWLNLQVLLVGGFLVMVVGLLAALTRSLRGPAFAPLRIVATAYVDLFRGIPLIIVLYLVGFGFPALGLQGMPTSPFVLGTAAIVLVYGAYVAEVFRAGIESVHPSQRASARALGLSYGQTMRHVVFPQAVRRVLPPLLNDFVSLQKDTSLVSTLGVIEMVLTAENLQSQDFKFVHMVFAGLIFVALTVPLTRLTDWAARRQGWVNAGAII
jgi:polar amino acid transport system permease protein